MNSTRKRKSSFTVFLAVLLIAVDALCPFGAASATIIDGCTLAHTQAAANSLIFINVTTNAATAQQLNAVVQVEFHNCLLPNASDIRIGIPVNGTTSTNGVLIDIRNTTMVGGSFKVVPTAQHGNGALQDVRIRVSDNTVLVGSGDMVVVDATQNTNIILSNVALEISNAVLISQSGNIASFVASSAEDVVHRQLHIRIGSNTTLQTKGLHVGSVVATNVADSSLTLDNSDCLGPVIAFAGDPTLVANTVTVLSFVPPSPQSRSVDMQVSLALDNCHIVVLNTHAADHCPLVATSMNLTATIDQGAAAVASICVHYVSYTRLRLTNNFSIDVCLRHHDDLQVTTSLNKTHHELAALTHNSRTAAAVGSIVMLSNDAGHPTLEISNCSLHVYFTDGNVFSPGSASVGSTAFVARAGTQAAASVLGIALNTFSSERHADTSITVTDSSEIVIASTLTSNGKITVSSKVDRLGASTVLGIAVSTWSRDSFNKNYLRVTQKSAITLAISVSSSSGNLALSSQTNDHTSSSVSGISLNSFSDLMSPWNRVLVFENSRIHLVSDINTNGTVSVVSEAKVRSATAVFGISLFSRTNHRGAALSFVQDSSSSFKILSVLSGSGVMVQAKANSVSVAAVLGIATASTKHDAENAEATFVVDGPLAVNAAISNEATVLAHVERVDDSSSVGVGIVVYADEVATLTLGLRGILSVWVAATNHSYINATGNSRNTAAVGLVASTTFQHLRPNNTILTFCSDGTVSPSSRSGITVGVKPSDGIVDFTRHDKEHFVMDEMCIHYRSSLEQTILDIINKITPGSCSRPPSTATLSLLPTVTSTRMLPISMTATGRSSKTLSTLVATDSVSKSRTISVEPEIAALPPPTPAPPRERSVSITNDILLPGDKDAATVVLSTAGASNALSSTLGSGGGGLMVVADSSIRMMECGLADNNPMPPTFELPIQFALGNGKMRYFAGAAVAHTLLLMVFFALPVVLRRFFLAHNRKRKLRRKMKAVTYFSMLFCGAQAFFTPAILGACSAVLNNSDDKAGLAAASFSAMVIVAIHLVIVAAIHFGPHNGIVAVAVPGLDGRNFKLEFKLRSSTSSETSTTTSSSSSTHSSSDSDSTSDDYRGTSSDEDDEADEDRSTTTTSSGTTTPSSSGSLSEKLRRSGLLFSGAATKGILSTLFDGCRIFEKISHRHYASIETTLFSIISIISGSRPKENCSYATFAIGAIAISHLLYIVVVRPLRTALDTSFCLLNSVLVVVLSVSVAVAVQRNAASGDYEPPNTVLRIMEVCIWLLSGLGFVQLVVQGYWAYHVQQRRRHREQLREQERNEEMRNIDSADAPLLNVAEMDNEMMSTSSSSDAKQSHNPLTSGSL